MVVKEFMNVAQQQLNIVEKTILEFQNNEVWFYFEFLRDEFETHIHEVISENKWPCRNKSNTEEPYIHCSYRIS